MHVLPKSGRRGIGLKGKSKVSVRVRTEGTEASVIGQVRRWKNSSGVIPNFHQNSHVKMSKSCRF